MALLSRPYDHPVVREYVDPDIGVPECGACGAPTTGVGVTLRHRGEAVRACLPARRDVAAVHTAVDLAVRAQARLEIPGVSQEITPHDVARVIVEELYGAGALRTSRSAWRRPDISHHMRRDVA